MKHARLTVRPDLDAAPPFLAFLLDSPAVEEARAVDWNRGSGPTSTHVYAVDGDGDQFADLARDEPGVESVTAATDGAVAHALLEIRDDDVPVFGGSAAAVDRPGLVVRRPLVYRDGRIHGHLVGDPDALQGVVEDAPDAVAISIDRIGQFPSPQADPATVLSDRQAEAVAAALDLGYYDTPRDATHEDVAEALGCAPSTATTHLQKAEAKLVRAGVTALGSRP
jgi:predicted DNA binding protein